MTQLNYFDAVDYPSLIAEYGRPEDFVKRFKRLSRDELNDCGALRALSMVTSGRLTISRGCRSIQRMI